MIQRSTPLFILLAALGCGGGGPTGTPPGGNGAPPAGTVGAAPGSGTTPAAANVAAIVVDPGPDDVGYTNGLFASVTLCVPGTGNCQTVDHLLVDTGSVGVRILGSVLTIPLPAVLTGGVALAECSQFVLGFTWGPVRRADVKMADEHADSIPVQVIEATTYPVADSCTGTSHDTVQTLGANGILGLGPFLADCGAACEQALGPNSLNPGLYYACGSAAAGGCAETAVAGSFQVSHPVAGFAVDHNGTIIQLPAIADAGAPGASGSLVFGIGTQTNNGLGAATVLTLDDRGGFTTNYPPNGPGYESFIDSGSNGLYFLDSSTTGIPTCPDPASSYYCPAARLALSAESVGQNGVPIRTDFSVENADTLFANANYIAFADLAGPVKSSLFDWGLPFFYGKSIFTAIEGQHTGAGTGPFHAY